MKYYRMRFANDSFSGFIAKKELDYDFINSFDGRSHKKDWTLLEVRKIEETKQLPLSNAPYFFIPIFDKKALTCVYDLIKNDVEILPITFEKEEYYAINVTNVIDAINYDESEYIKFKDSDKIMIFNKYVFNKSSVENQNIFKIIDEPHRWAFVSEKFKNKIEENHLTGFTFEFVCEV